VNPDEAHEPDEARDLTDWRSVILPFWPRFAELTDRRSAICYQTARIGTIFTK